MVHGVVHRWFGHSGGLLVGRVRCRRDIISPAALVRWEVYVPGASPPRGIFSLIPSSECHAFLEGVPLFPAAIGIAACLFIGGARSFGRCGS